MAVPATLCGSDNASVFTKSIKPLLQEYCFDCHGDGAKKGGVAFDEAKSDAELISNHTLWWNVLKNVRGGIMPPEKKSKPSKEQISALERWIKFEAFGIDPKDPDPGRVTLRRLNRNEYQNTIRDLMGHNFRADEEFPPDDTGYGFDNIGDVLTISPLLLEKYMQAAEMIVSAAVPTVAKVVPVRIIGGGEFKTAAGEGKKERFSFYEPVQLSHTTTAKHDGEYKVTLEVDVIGEFAFDPGKCRVTFSIDGKEKLREPFDWEPGKKFQFHFPEKWNAGEHTFELALEPLTPKEEKTNSLDLRVSLVRVEGPQDPKHWMPSRNYDRFFPRESVPTDSAERRKYAEEILRNFAFKAYRRPADEKAIQRLVGLAQAAYEGGGKSFEQGLSQAFVALLASPRFIFRTEGTETGSSGHPEVDEYALASRLSYFLWSTMPDQELFDLAKRGELRKNLSAQVKRMMQDSKANELLQNFTGQWLQVRDVEGVSIDPRWILARDDGTEKDLKRLVEEFRQRRGRPFDGTNRPPDFERRRQLFGKYRYEFDGELRTAMRRETEMLFGHIAREDRSLLELISSDYTFLNERLAKHYGIEGIQGKEMRKVTLETNSHRGSVLAHGSVLAVTSNPTRTSPVKRGLFVLENLLGTPPPPPPADVPDLEESEKGFTDKEPTLREVLELHRNKALCSSCHSRMDPLGLALENFNAMGMWRDKERAQPIDSAGKLITGEPFKGLDDLKQILVTSRRKDFYRCLTEKMMTYALGRGLEHYDVHSVDGIVERLEAKDGRFSALLTGIIESAPFQKTRANKAVMAANTAK